MRMLPYYRNRAPALAGAFCVVLATCLTGCASKSPLQSESVASNSATGAVPTGVQQSKQGRFLGIFSPYRIDIQQGNFISREMVAQLKEGMKRPEGMTKAQVRFVLGTPLLTDVFHAERWDYPFRLLKGNGEIIQSQLTVFFKDDRLTRFEGGDLPTEKEYIALIAGGARALPVQAAPEAAPAAK